MLKKICGYIILFLFICIELWLLYSAIGYLVLGLNTPKIIGDSTTTVFMGMFIMSITYASIFVVCLILFIVIMVIFHKKKKVKGIDNSGN